MDFITVPNCRLGKDHPYPETINIEHIVAISNGRIDLVNGQFIAIPDNTYKEIREFLSRKGHTISRLGD